SYEFVVGPQFDITRDQVEGALVGVAFLEQNAAGAQFFDMGLAGERMQVLGLQAVQRRESLENREIEWSFIHQTIRRRLWFQPHDFGCESYHMRRQIQPPWVTSSDGSNRN